MRHSPAIKGRASPKRQVIHEQVTTRDTFPLLMFLVPDVATAHPVDQAILRFQMFDQQGRFGQHIVRCKRSTISTAGSEVR